MDPYNSVTKLTLKESAIVFLEFPTFSAIKPLTYEDFAEFHLDINKIMRDAGINPDDYRNASPSLLAHIGTLLPSLWFLLIEYT